MCQTLNYVHAFDGRSYGYWKACMRFFLKSTDELTIVQTSTRLSNDKARDALCQALSPSKFARISNWESAQHMRAPKIPDVDF
jgi:hypothetical protein